MTDKEQLEEIKEQLEESNSYDDNPNGYWYNAINWLIEQAERVQELEDFKRNAEQLYKNYHLSAKKSVAEKEELRGQNKRYREALEFYAERDNYKLEHFDPNLNDYMSTVDYDEGQKARQTIGGEQRND